MKLQPRLAALAGLAISMCAPALLADVPPAMDRVPGATPVVLSIKNVKQFHSSVDKMVKMLKLPPQSMVGLTQAAEFLKTDGLNTDGSAAVAFMKLGKEADEEPLLVMILPVKDYAAFAKSLGGKGAGPEEVKYDGDTAFIKDVGGGFAAMSPKKELLDQVEGKPGNGKAFETLMGATGKAINDASDTIVFANMEAVGPMLKAGMADMKEQMEMMAAMGGGGANQAGFDMMQVLMEGFVNDSSAGVMGFKSDDGGVHMDFGAQFKEGSPFAGYFNAKGNAGKLMSALPNQPFMFAMSMDTSSPGVKALFKKTLDAAKKNPEAAKMMSGLNPLESIQTLDGLAMGMGTSPALMGGLFLNTTMYARTSDAAGYIKQMKDGFSAMNGKTFEGITYQTAYEAGAAKAGEKPVDAWSMKMQLDPNNPAAQQMGQMQMMLFGPSGMGGYISPADGGVVVTYAKNSELMTKALDAAKSGNGLGTDAVVKAVGQQLPADRNFEVQIGVKSILDTAIGFMGMMGAGPTDFKVPESVPPIGIAGTGTSGGMRMTVFLPTKTMETFRDLGTSMQGGEGGEEPADGEKAGQPKF